MEKKKDTCLIESASAESVKIPLQSLPFFRALRSHWLSVIVTFVLIGRCNY